jgi:hypothetical protein
MDGAIAFVQQIEMVSIDLAKSGTLARRPTDLYFVYLARLPKSEMQARIVL